MGTLASGNKRGGGHCEFFVIAMILPALQLPLISDNKFRNFEHILK